VPDPKNAADEVELQGLDAGHLTQLVLDQRLLGRAIHGFDPKTAEQSLLAGPGRQLHMSRRRLRAATGMTLIAMAHAVMGMVMIVLMMMRVFGADRLVHGSSLLSLLPSEHPVATIGSSECLEFPT